MADIKWSQFPSATPGNSDEVVGLHSGDNARFTIANIVAAVRNGLANIFVPKTDVGAAGGVAELDNTGKVPTTQLPPISSDADDITYDPTTSGASATNVQDAIDEVAADLDGKQSTITASGILKGDGQGGVTAATAGTDYQAPLTAGTDYITPAQLADKAAKSDLTSIQATGTTNTTGAAIPAGAYFYLNGVLHQAKTRIDVNATFTVNTNCEQVTVGSILTGTSVSTSAISMPGIAISRIRAGIVFLNIYDFKPSSASGTIPGTLPQELRPIQTTSGMVLSADGTKYARISISTQGVVTYTGVDTSEYHYGLISYPAAI